MPSTLQARLPAAFRTKLAQLSQRFGDLGDASQQLAEMYVGFCRLYYDISTDAEAMSPNQQRLALQALEASFPHVDKSVRSKWRMIGQHAPRLLAKPILKALPPTRDALYELAKAKPNKLAAFVAQGTLTPELSVAQVRSLVQHGKPTKPKRRQPSLQHLATIRLSFRTYAEAAQCLAPVMTHNAIQRVGAKPAYASALQVELGNDYSKVAKLFS